MKHRSKCRRNLNLEVTEIQRKELRVAADILCQLGIRNGRAIVVPLSPMSVVQKASEHVVAAINHRYSSSKGRILLLGFQFVLT